MVFFFLENNHFPEVSGESVSHHKLRYSNYKECLKSMKNQIEVVLNFCPVIKGLNSSCPASILFQVFHYHSLIESKCATQVNFQIFFCLVLYLLKSVHFVVWILSLCKAERHLF